MVAGVVLVVGWLVMVGCGAMLDRIDPTVPDPPDTSKVLPVSSKQSQGQICPVMSTRAWTAEHVSTRAEVLGGRVPVPLITEVAGKPATVMQYAQDARRDLAWVVLEEGIEFEEWYEISEDMPEEGDRVWLVGFDFEDGLKAEVVKAKVLNVRAGRIYYDASPGPGSSGSCVLNQAGEVVGIHTSIYVLWKGHEQHTTGSGYVIVGEWGKFWTQDEPE